MERVNKEMSRMLSSWYDQSVLAALARCESEIERLFLVASWRMLAPVSPADPQRTSYPNMVAHAGDIRLHAQECVGRYRIDFAVFDGPRKLGIELDGHDFHERTKEQARRDKQRERALMLDGWHVVRFTGSEVWAKPFQCFVDSLSLVQKMKGAA